MPGPFDPLQTRKGIESYLEILPQLLPDPDSEAVGQVAMSQMGSVVAGWLVGLEPEFRSHLELLRTHFEAANVKDEQFSDSPHFSSASRNNAYGLCCWMLGKPDPMPYSLSVRNWDAHFLTEGTKKKRGGPKFDYAAQRYEDPYIRNIPFEPQEILRGSLADYLGSCVQGAQFSRGVELYERVGGKTDISDTRIQTDVHLGYWLCKRAESGGILPDGCQTIGKRVLKANLQGVWLNYGQYVRAATWLKIVATHANWQMSPLESILHAYELMPDVERPEFL